MAATDDAVTDAGGSRLPLALRIFLLTAALVALAVGASVLVTQLVGKRIAREAVASALSDSIDAQRSVLGQRLDLLERTIQLLAADPALANYVAAAIGDDLGLGADTAPDSASIRDLLLERRAQFGFDVGMVLDAEGMLIARGDEAEAFSESFADDALVAPALAELEPVSGFWRHEDMLYQAAITPLAQGPSLVGFLLVAQRVDDVLSRDIARGSDAQIAFWLPSPAGPKLVASSLPEAQAQALEAHFAANAAVIDALQLGRTLERQQIEVDGGEWLVRLSPTAAGAAELGAVAALASSSAAASGYRQILNLVLLAGVASLALALALSFWLSGRILRPVGRLADAAERAAAGDYHASTKIAGNDELARLGSAFDTLLSDLREKRDIEGYVATFSRFLPDAQEPEPATPVAGADVQALPGAERADAVLLGVEHATARGMDDEAGVLAHAQDIAGELAAIAQACGGRLVSGDGERWTLAFEGGERIERALQAARVVLTELPAGATAPSLALAEGDVLRGGMQVSGLQATAVLGTPGRQLVRLLCESAPGRALIARPLGERIRERFGTEALEVASGALAGRRYFALRLEGLHGLPEPEPPPPAADAPTQMLPAAAPRGDRDLQPGSRFGGRYQILSTLGAGGMGVVYKARDLELADIVALKTLRPGALADREQLERLKDEIRLARRITHPNVLRTFDFGEVDGLPYISMEYVRGVTLRALLEQSGRLPYSAGLRIARQLAAGLAAAHAVGVLHRDIKPENLILEAGGNARLMDFGIARPARRSRPGLTQPGMYVGTPNYSAPEQLAGEELDDRADIYACGALMSEMFCGGLPYRGDTTMEIYLAQVQQEPVRPSALWPEIPPELERIILRCIARRREDRFQSAVELGEALSELRA